MSGNNLSVEEQRARARAWAANTLPTFNAQPIAGNYNIRHDAQMRQRARERQQALANPQALQQQVQAINAATANVANVGNDRR